MELRVAWQRTGIPEVDAWLVGFAERIDRAVDRVNPKPATAPTEDRDTMRRLLR